MRQVIKAHIELARTEVIDEDCSVNHIHRDNHREPMRDTLTQRLLVRAPVWQALLVLLLTLSIGNDESRVAAKDEVKNNPPQISSVFPQGARCGSQIGRASCRERAQS